MGISLLAATTVLISNAVKTNKEATEEQEEVLTEESDE